MGGGWRSKKISGREKERSRVEWKGECVRGKMKMRERGREREKDMELDQQNNYRQWKQSVPMDDTMACAVSLDDDLRRRRRRRKKKKSWAGGRVAAGLHRGNPVSLFSAAQSKGTYFWKVWAWSTAAARSVSIAGRSIHLDIWEGADKCYEKQTHTMRCDVKVTLKYPHKVISSHQYVPGGGWTLRYVNKYK